MILMTCIIDINLYMHTYKYRTKGQGIHDIDDMTYWHEHQSPFLIRHYTTSMFNHTLITCDIDINPYTTNHIDHPLCLFHINVMKFGLYCRACILVVQQRH